MSSIQAPRSMSEHHRLTKIIKALGYPGEHRGFCFGSSAIAMQAILQGPEAIAHFNKRMKILREFQIPEWGTSPEEIEQALKDHIKKSIMKFELTDKEDWKDPEWDVLAFLESVVVFHSFDAIKRRWSKDTLTYSPQKIEEPSSFVLSGNLSESHDGIRQLKKFSGAYNREEVLTYFKSLRQALGESAGPLSFVLSNVDHTIVVGYDHGKWKFFDVNGFDSRRISEIIPDLGTKAVLTEELLVKLIFSSFSEKKEHVIFSTQIYGTGLNESLQQTQVESWTQTEMYQRLHEPSSEKSQRLDSDTASLLMLATIDEEIDFIKKLLLSGADPNQVRQSNNLTPIWIAVLKENLQLVECLLKAGADPNHKRQEDQASVLLMAVLKGNLEIARLLLEAGANPNEQDDLGRGPPLLLAVQKKNIPLVKLLLQFGARSDQENELTGKTPLLEAKQQNDTAMIELLNEANTPDKHVQMDTLPFLNALHTGNSRPSNGIGDTHLNTP